MSTHILKCPKCGKYTIRNKCPSCGIDTLTQVPAKYSPEDTYGKYRREVKKEQLKEKGIL